MILYLSTSETKSYKPICFIEWSEGNKFKKAYEKASYQVEIHSIADAIKRGMPLPHGLSEVPSIIEEEYGWRIGNNDYTPKYCSLKSMDFWICHPPISALATAIVTSHLLNS
ncbi:MAG: hypothetical protein AAGA75_24475 [Cyanobacteria bacterium P01_E01_bin.6]